MHGVTGASEYIMHDAKLKGKKGAGRDIMHAVDESCMPLGSVKGGPCMLIRGWGGVHIIEAMHGA